MMSTILFLSLLAALLELDTTYAFQFLVSRPIIAGPILGFVTGDVLAGIQVGVFTELLCADVSPLGGIIPPSGVVASVVPLALHHMGIELYFGFFIGIIAAILYSFIDTYLRKTRFTWMVYVETKIAKTPYAVLHVLGTSLLLSFLVTFVFVSLAIWISMWALAALFPYLNFHIHLAFRLAYMAVPWIGLTTLIPIFRLKAR